MKLLLDKVSIKLLEKWKYKRIQTCYVVESEAITTTPLYHWSV